MKTLRPYFVQIIAAVLGATAGFWSAVYTWDRIVPPPRCRVLPPPVHPMVCISGGPPVWLTVLGITIGALIGIAMYRLVRSRRVRANAWVVAHPIMYAVVLGGVLGVFHLTLNALLRHPTSWATLILWVIVFPTIMTSIARARARAHSDI